MCCTTPRLIGRSLCFLRIHKQVPSEARMDGAVCELDDNKPRGTGHSLKISASWSPPEAGFGDMQCPR